MRGLGLKLELTPERPNESQNLLPVHMNDSLADAAELLQGGLKERTGSPQVNDSGNEGVRVDGVTNAKRPIVKECVSTALDLREMGTRGDSHLEIRKVCGGSVKAGDSMRLRCESCTDSLDYARRGGGKADEVKRTRKGEEQQHSRWKFLLGFEGNLRTSCSAKNLGVTRTGTRRTPRRSIFARTTEGLQ